MNYKEVAAGIFAILLMSGGFVYVESTGNKKVCRNGLWTPINDTHYQCTSNQNIEMCVDFVNYDTMKTCLTGRVVVYNDPQVSTSPSSKNSCGSYRCYEGKDYCRLHGLLINDKVKRSDVCG